MALNLIALNEETRRFMTDEIENDIVNRTLYMSRRLSQKGRRDYVGLLKEAVGQHDEEWLAAQLGSEDRLGTLEGRQTEHGKKVAKVPVTAAETLAEGEFNRYYMRGLCRRAIDSGIPRLVVYRA